MEQRCSTEIPAEHNFEQNPFVTGQRRIAHAEGGYGVINENPAQSLLHGHQQPIAYSYGIRMKSKGMTDIKHTAERLQRTTKSLKLVTVVKSTNFGTTKIGRRQQDLFGLESAGGQKLSGVL